MRKSDPSNVSHIVVRGTNWVGDTVMTIPALRALRRIFPDARITMWVSAGLVPLTQSTGVPDEVISFDGTFGGPLTRPFRVRGDLSRGKFDMAVLFQNAFESAFTAWLARIPVRVGFPTDLRGPLLNVRVPLTQETRRKHQVFYYLAVTNHLEERILGKSDSSEPDCSVRIGPESLKRAGRILAENGLNPGRSFFCLCPGSVNSEAKRWPAENFAGLADLLIKRGAAVVFLGAPGEKVLVDGIIARMRGEAINLAGRTGMTDSLAVMNLSDMVISNDTGSAHLAVAAAACVLTIFGPTIPGATAPYGKRAHIIQGNAECAPCRNFRCPISNHPCMKSITPESVLASVDKIFDT
ncbi:MAG: lipopolysaccharide heptosyltransferase II [Desulfomonile tiedjei]|uniref:lipopolysaccharide heptosyltransferase II n=1 Tax=Desulfomonile tiedjei TaxID=2358 RepID=A0A9D6V1P1_9BACT|nr:lipopolysaccharide heptosyltransferase II [Desulfomonile tiedjei]